MTQKVFRRVAEQLLSELPADIREKIGNVAILIENDPPPEDADLMGVFQGASYDEGDPVLPNQIVLYKNNIESECEDEEQVREEIRITLLHEIGHFLGLDEDDLADRGLD
ncbi:MAG: metallopeptidase family protein [Verrucomicrobiae bacterium]|nr:metallopeptidase family protein [Verrucomicrobiae bacterium]